MTGTKDILLLQVVGESDGEPVTLAAFNYFQFGGTDAQRWAPAHYAKVRKPLCCL